MIKTILNLRRWTPWDSDVSPGHDPAAANGFSEDKSLLILSDQLQFTTEEDWDGAIQKQHDNKRHHQPGWPHSKSSDVLPRLNSSNGGDQQQSSLSATAERCLSPISTTESTVSSHQSDSTTATSNWWWDNDCQLEEEAVSDNQQQQGEMQTSTGTLVDFFSASSGRTTPDFFSIESPTAADLRLSPQSSHTEDNYMAMKQRLDGDFTSAHSQLTVFNDPVVPSGATIGSPGSFEEFVLDRIATFQATHHQCKQIEERDAVSLCDCDDSNSEPTSGKVSLSKEGNYHRKLSAPQSALDHLSQRINSDSNVNIKGLNNSAISDIGLKQIILSPAEVELSEDRSEKSLSNDLDLTLKENHQEDSGGEVNIPLESGVSMDGHYCSNSSEDALLDTAGKSTYLRAKRPDHLDLSSSPTSCTASQDITVYSTLNTMSSTGQDNVVKECWVEEINEVWEELPSTACPGGDEGKVLTRHPAYLSLCKSDNNLFSNVINMRTVESFTGGELLAWFSHHIAQESEDLELINSFCTQLLRIGTLEQITYNDILNNNHRPLSRTTKLQQFKLDERYRWVKSEGVAQTPPANSSLTQEEKIKKLRSHNKTLKTRVNHLTEQLNKLELTQQTDLKAASGSNVVSPAACQIEVRSEGKSSTSVSMPSTVLSISTFNEGNGSHVSLSFTKSDSQISGYRSKDNSQTPVAPTDTPNSCDSFLTASESEHQSPSRQKSHDLHSNITTTPVSSSNQSTNDNHVRGRGQDDSASTLCSNCSQVLLTARNRLSNASIDSGLSQSCVAFPSSHVTGNDGPQDTPTKLTREIPTSQSTPFFHLGGSEEDEEALPFPPADAIPPPPSFLPPLPPSTNHSGADISSTSLPLPNHTSNDMLIPPPPPLMTNQNADGSMMIPPPPPLITNQNLENSMIPPPPPLMSNQSSDNNVSIPPPPPPMPNHGSSDISMVPPPPPPMPNQGMSNSLTAPPPPGGPPPPPPALHGLANLNHTIPFKKVQKSRYSLKPLHWKRIQLHTHAVAAFRRGIKQTCKTVWEKLEEPNVDTDELEELFALDTSNGIKPTMSAPQLAATMRKSKNFTKVLDKKRSQNLGIILSSIRLPFAEFKQALISFDSSFVAIDTWQAIYDLRATEKEMTEIQDHMETNSKCLLDKPEEFLYNLHKISFGVDRIRCILLKSRHEELLNDITSQLDNINTVCDHMTNSKQIENLLSLLLAVGNFLNGGNNHRGQADGFSLEILPKLKDIKSKKQTSLLQYIANKYKSLYGDDSDSHSDISPHISSSYFSYTLPVPCVSKLVTASDTSFGELSKTINILNKELKDVESLMTKVETTLTDSSDNQTFYDVMSSFISQSRERITDLQKTLDTSKDGFSKMCQFYSAPTADWQKIIPSQFFEPWISFSRDLSAVWEPVRNNPSRASAHF